MEDENMAVEEEEEDMVPLLPVALQATVHLEVSLLALLKAPHLVQTHSTSINCIKAGEGGC